MGVCVHIALICSSFVFHTLHGEIYFEPENEETIRRRCPPSLRCFPTQLEWAELNHNMTGTLVWPGDENYTHYNWQFNLAQWKYPIVHAVCKTVEDIQMSVKFAKKHNLRVTIKSEGREPWGRSSAHGSLTINLMEMNAISVNPDPTERSAYGEATVETGVSAKAIYAKLTEHGRMVPLENDGLALHISTGGYGYTSPALGLGVDSVLEIQVVLADGRVATCTHNKTVIESEGAVEIRNDGELFWAMRGGGGGTFGIVVNYTLQLKWAPVSFVFFEITGSINGSHAQMLNESIDLYAEWVRTTPTHWGGFFAFWDGYFMIRLLKYGIWDDNIESELGQFLDLQSRYSHLLNKVIKNVSSSEDVVYYGYPPVRTYFTGAFIPSEKHVSADLRDLLVEEVMKESNGRMICLFMRLGGKVAEYGIQTSSVHPGLRRAESHLVCWFDGGRDHTLSSIKQHEGLKAKAAQFAEKLRPFQDGQNTNMGYIPSPNWKMDFWGQHYVDLLKVKIRYDPDNFFTCYHCVGSDRTDFDDDSSDDGDE